MDIQVIKIIAGVVALTPLFAVALALGRIFSSYNEAVSRNPACAEFLDKKYFLAFALTEALAIFALLVSFYLIFA
jgi:F0F1-type ATP synthase membrane subunit c/vacuolar-type H+-ATPase subunit K